MCMHASISLISMKLPYCFLREEAKSRYEALLELRRQRDDDSLPGGSDDGADALSGNDPIADAVGASVSDFPETQQDLPAPEKQDSGLLRAWSEDAQPPFQHSSSEEVLQEQACKDGCGAIQDDGCGGALQDDGYEGALQDDGYGGALQDDGYGDLSDVQVSPGSSDPCV